MVFGADVFIILSKKISKKLKNKRLCIKNKPQFCKNRQLEK